MKKKLLSLVLAGAMVASTSVSAFADTFEILEKQETEVQVQVKGDVENNSGNIVPGSINVTVPTAASFRVTQEGAVSAPSIDITSQGEESVSVIAYKFIDPTQDSGITVVSERELADASDRSKVSLTLTGTSGSVVLKSEKGANNGLYKSNGSDAADANTVLGTVTKTNPLKLTLTGAVKSESQAPQQAITDNFTLVLKIKKTN